MTGVGEVPADDFIVPAGKGRLEPREHAHGLADAHVAFGLQEVQRHPDRFLALCRRVPEHDQSEVVVAVDAPLASHGEQRLVRLAHVVAAAMIFILLGERTVGELGKRHVLQAQSPLLVVPAGGLDVAACGLLLQALEGLRDRKLDRQREERVDDAGPRAVRPILDGNHRGVALARGAAEHDPVAFETNRIVGKVGVEQGIEPASSHWLRRRGRRNEILQRGKQAVALERCGP